MFIIHVESSSVPGPPGMEDTAIRFDKSYLKTLDFGLKICVIIACIVGAICSEISMNTTSGYYEFHAYTGLIMTTWLLILYLFRFVYKIKIPWFIMEAVYCGVMALLNLIGMICMFAAPWYQNGSQAASIAAGIFALFACACYGVDAARKFLTWRTGVIGPGAAPSMTTTAFSDTGPKTSSPPLPAY